MSVVGGDWENLKRFNLAEIYQPKNAAAAKSEQITSGAGAPTEEAPVQAPASVPAQGQAPAQAPTEAAADIDRTEDASSKVSTI